VVAPSVRLEWKTPPDTLNKQLFRYDAQIRANLHAVFDLFQARTESLARQSAPWNDQTGAARQGLRAQVQKSSSGAILYLIHSVYYGIYLELGTSKMGPRPVIQPTLEQTYGPLMAMCRAIVGG
jgi:hypothetical protein